MFKRRLGSIGKLTSDEGFTLAYGNRSVTYTDARGAFEFGFEDGFLFTPPYQVKGAKVSLNDSDVDVIIKRVIRGIESEGHSVRVHLKE
jgi:hypothetical protein